MNFSLIGEDPEKLELFTFIKVLVLHVNAACPHGDSALHRSVDDYINLLVLRVKGIFSIYSLRHTCANAKNVKIEKKLKMCWFYM